MMPDSQPSMLDDSTLVRQAKSGDSDAFGTLYERYAGDIYRFLKAQVGDTLEAEDLTSEVFIRAWGALSRYRERGFNFSALLYKIARNALIDHWRKKRREGNNPRLVIDEVESNLTDPGDRYPDQEDKQALWSILGEIREDYRTVLVLRFINGLSPREIGPIMGRSDGAVRVLQFRALEAVRKHIALQEKLDDDER